MGWLVSLNCVVCVYLNLSVVGAFLKSLCTLSTDDLALMSKDGHGSKRTNYGTPLEACVEVLTDQGLIVRCCRVDIN